MVDKGLVDWITRNKDKGYSPNEMREYLQKYGYSPTAITEAFEGLGILRKETPEAPVQEDKEETAEPEETSAEPSSDSDMKYVIQPEKVAPASDRNFYYQVKHRNVALMVILTIITFGVYWFYWMWKSSKEISLTTGMMPRRIFILPSIALTPFLVTVAMTLFVASQIDTRGSRLFIQYGSLVFLGIVLVFLIFLGTFFWTYALAVQPIIELPSWLVFILMITIAPSIIIMIATQSRLNTRAQ